MLACVSPADSQFAETRSTLEFAGRASAIVNKATKNEIETMGKNNRSHAMIMMIMMMIILDAMCDRSMHKCLYVCVYVCVCMSVCVMHVCMFVCMYVYLFMHAFRPLHSSLSLLAFTFAF